MQGKVAPEEHFALPDTVQDSAGFLANEAWTEPRFLLLDMQDRRLREMDAHGIETLLPSLDAPAVQASPNQARVIQVARRADDFLTEEVAKRRDRILFSADWPFENIDHAAIWFDACTISQANRLKVGRTNARGLSGLNRAQGAALAQAAEMVA